MAQANDEAWRYQLDEAFTHKSSFLAEIEYANRWVTIIDQELIVTRGYAWDGCTPSYYLPFIGWVGTPDGERDENGIPQSYYASLVHDVLCRYRHEIPISKAQTVAIFHELLLQGGFSKKRADLYASMVKMFGPQKWLVADDKATPSGAANGRSD